MMCQRVSEPRTAESPVEPSSQKLADEKVSSTATNALSGLAYAAKEAEIGLQMIKAVKRQKPKLLKKLCEEFPQGLNYCSTKKETVWTYSFNPKKVQLALEVIEILYQYNEPNKNELIESMHRGLINSKFPDPTALALHLVEKKYVDPNQLAIKIIPCGYYTEVQRKIFVQLKKHCKLDYERILIASHGYGAEFFDKSEIIEQATLAIREQKKEYITPLLYKFRSTLDENFLRNTIHNAFEFWEEKQISPIDFILYLTNKGSIDAEGMAVEIMERPKKGVYTPYQIVVFRTLIDKYQLDLSSIVPNDKWNSTLEPLTGPLVKPVKTPGPLAKLLKGKK